MNFKFFPIFQSGFSLKEIFFFFFCFPIFVVFFYPYNIFWMLVLLLLLFFMLHAFPSSVGKYLSMLCSTYSNIKNLLLEWILLWFNFFYVFFLVYISCRLLKLFAEFYNLNILWKFFFRLIVENWFYCNIRKFSRILKWKKEN